MTQSVATAAPPSTAITWFQIPAADLQRAQRFYETIFEAPLTAVDFAGAPIAVFPCQEGGVGGCLAQASHPSPHGTLVLPRQSARGVPRPRAGDAVTRLERSAGAKP
jgi:catechol 2,3-dioxygenase-like lactoylglutathione lyase family enzyme